MDTVSREGAPGPRPDDEAAAAGGPGEATVDSLLRMIRRIAAGEPHAHCAREAGALGRVTVALNALSEQLTTRDLTHEEAFGPRALFTQSANSMFCCDRDARVRYMNFTIPGLTVNELLGQDVMQWVAPESRATVRALIDQVLTQGKPGDCEARTLVQGGGEWFSARMGPIVVEGQIIGFTVIQTDITELKRAQQRLEQSNRELESFASIASHDLQEPLRKIQAFGARLKKTATPLGPDAEDSLKRMQAAATRMRRLIDDLLSFSRVSARGQPFTSVALADVVGEVLEDLEAPIEQAGATVTHGELPEIEADATQMRQLLQNVVGNALKFRREGTPPVVSITATVDSTTRRCTLTVRDNGIGFDDQHRERIFEVFRRLHGRGQYEGTGIGLAICRKIAERHGGGIEARGTPGVGACFHITLPLEQPQRP